MKKEGGSAGIFLRIWQTRHQRMAHSTYVCVVQVIYIDKVGLVVLVVRALGDRKTAHTSVMIHKASVKISLIIDIFIAIPKSIEVSDHVAEGRGDGVVDVAVLCLGTLAAVLGGGGFIRQE